MNIFETISNPKNDAGPCKSCSVLAFITIRRITGEEVRHTKMGKANLMYLSLSRVNFDRVSLVSGRYR